MIPVAISVAGLRLSLPTTLFLGWFGPRGIASILFALLILEDHPIPGGEELLACIVITVALSILLHGITAAPLAKAYGVFVKSRGESAETEDVSEMPVRHGFTTNQMTE
jgi:NhaP-type Na+/H+ or K+/H+ antiporter